MKKLFIFLVTVAMLLSLFSCGTIETTLTPATTAAPEGESNNPSEAVQSITSFSGTLNAAYEAAVFGASSDTASLVGYDFFGESRDVVARVTQSYPSNRRWYFIDEDGAKVESSYDEAVKLGFIAAKVETSENGVNEITLRTVEARAVLEYDSVSAQAGAYVTFDFYASIPASFTVGVTEERAGALADALYIETKIPTETLPDGSAIGLAKFTLPNEVGRTYYLNVYLGERVLSSIPVTTTEPTYHLPFWFVFQGDWEMIADDGYIDNVYRALYNSYPRAYQRWAYNGDESLTLYVVADKDYDGVAYNSGNTVAVSVDFANDNPDDIGLFAHEFTHAIQAGYGISYDNGWFTEAMADYGRFRFFHWGYDEKYLKIYEMDDPAIRDFRNSGDTNDPQQWYGYAQHNIFMAYLDWRWPTTDKNGDGTVTPDEYGLIDHIVYEAKQWQRAGNDPVWDYPYTEGSTFNNWVKDITDLATMELVRRQFVAELDAGTFVFNGFRDYPDNFLIEDCYDIPDLTYPMR